MLKKYVNLKPKEQRYFKQVPRMLDHDYRNHGKRGKTAWMSRVWNNGNKQSSNCKFHNSYFLYLFIYGN